jgi:hypothetical protein
MNKTPVYKRERLYDLSTGRLLSEAGFDITNYGSTMPWQWIKETLAVEFECSEDTIDILETDEGDVYTACGVPVAYSEWVPPFPSPVNREVLQAAAMKSVSIIVAAAVKSVSINDE